SCIGIGRRIAADRARGNGSVPSQLHPAGEDAARAAFIHHEQHKIRSFSTYLKAKASTFERHHRRSAPGSRKAFTLAPRHSAAPVASPDDERSLQDRRKDNDAIRLVEQV